VQQIVIELHKVRAYCKCSWITNYKLILTLQQVTNYIECKQLVTQFSYFTTPVALQM